MSAAMEAFERKLKKAVRHPLHPCETARRLRAMLSYVPERELELRFCAAIRKHGDTLEAISAARDAELVAIKQSIANWGTNRRTNMALMVLNELQMLLRWQRRYGAAQQRQLEAAE